MSMGVKISLVEFEDGTAFTVERLKDWFPRSKFDKRFPQEYVRKWLRVNDKSLKFLGISYNWDEDSKSLILTPTNKIGLAPLKNPYGGQVYGSILVKPRLGWLKIYEILDIIGWKYHPAFLKDEEPIISDGILPRWFKSIETLEAIFQALNLFMRGLNSKQVQFRLPVGSVNWNEYATKSVPYGMYDLFFTTITDYSNDLEIHRQFKGVVKMIAEDVSNPCVPIKIQNKAKRIIVKIENKLIGVNHEEPSIERLKKIRVPNFYRTHYEKAVKKCIEYISESKFSMEIGNFYGLPWTIEMDRLFEYWVEYWAYKFAKQIGARFFSDIRNNSRIRFYNLRYWKSINKLKPDIIIEKEDKTLIIDVKYKKHLLYLQYGKISSEILEDHRHDIHQILSYMSSSVNKKRIGCLLYPQLNESVSNQFSTIINYTNMRAYVDIALCNVNFEPNSVLNLLNNLWNEKYASFA